MSERKIISFTEMLRDEKERAQILMELEHYCQVMRIASDSETRCEARKRFNALCREWIEMEGEYETQEVTKSEKTGNKTIG